MQSPDSGSRNERKVRNEADSEYEDEDEDEIEDDSAWATKLSKS